MRRPGGAGAGADRGVVRRSATARPASETQGGGQSKKIAASPSGGGVPGAGEPGLVRGLKRIGAVGEALGGAGFKQKGGNSCFYLLDRPKVETEEKGGGVMPKRGGAGTAHAGARRQREAGGKAQEDKAGRAGGG